MSKKIKIRFLIGLVAFFAAAITLTISSGLFSFWANNLKFVTESGNYTGNSFYYAIDPVSLGAGQEYKTPLGALRFESVYQAGNDTVAEFTFVNEFGFDGGKFLSAKPVFPSTRDYITSLSANNRDFAFYETTFDNNLVCCKYIAEGANAETFDGATFTFSDIVVNEYKKK